MHNSSASLSDLQGGYFEMLKMNDDHRVASGCSQISVGGIDALSRWAETRARHHPWGSRSSPGRAPGTSAALRSSQAQLIVCAKPGCGELVPLQSARQAARKALGASPTPRALDVPVVEPPEGVRHPLC